MNLDEVRKRAFAMPLTSPAFPPGPYRFIDREYLIITYRTAGRMEFSERTGISAMRGKADIPYSLTSVRS